MCTICAAYLQLNDLSLLLHDSLILLAELRFAGPQLYGHLTRWHSFRFRCGRSITRQLFVLRWPFQ
jgi:hypothetical protein